MLGPYNINFKPRLRRSDAPLQAPFANGFAIFSQTLPSAARRLSKCYMSFRNTLLCITVLFFLPTSYADFAWFERTWISDGPQTIDANEELISGWDSKQVEMFQSTFGKMEWHVKDGIVSVLIANTKMDLAYSYRPSQDGGFELFMEDGEAIPLTKTSAGFCVTFKTPASSTGVVNECYRPAKDI